MLDSIKFWISASRGAVKICVSSREDNVFENSFPPEKRLRLQDLTERDMARYVQDKLQDVQDLEVRGRLVHEIASRSEGIFLWTVLVVKALRECLEESQDLQAFEKELHSLPNELEALFEHLLGSIRRSARERAYRIFAMVSKLNERQAQLPLLSCMFVDEYARNPGFAVETTSRHLEIMGETQDKRHYREVQLARARKLVQGSCKGLVEIRDAKMDTRRLDVKCVMFTHRTIPEFLQRSKIQTEMALHLEGFKLEDGIAQLLLAEIRSTDSVFLNPEYWGKTLFAALAIRCYAGMDMVPYSYLTILEEELKRKNLGPPLDLDARFTYQGMTLVEYGIEVFMTPSVRQQRRPGEAYRFRLSLPSYIYARLGAANYVNWKIRQDPDLVKTEFRKSLLLVCLTKSLYQACFTVQRDATIDCFKLLTVDGVPTYSRLLLQELILERMQWSDSMSCCCSQTFGRVFEIFLKKAGRGKHLSWAVRYKITSVLGDSGQGKMRLWITQDGLKLADVSLSTGEQYPTTTSLLGLGRQPIGLRDLIGLWALDNKEDLLLLIDEMEESDSPGEKTEQPDARQQIITDEQSTPSEKAAFKTDPTITPASALHDKTVPSRIPMSTVAGKGYIRPHGFGRRCVLLAIVGQYISLETLTLGHSR